MTEIELFRSPNLIVRQVGDSGTACFVTFGSHDSDPSLDRLGFGEAFLRGEGIAAIHVLSSDNRWYQYDDMADALAAIARATQHFENVVSYGSSMGGYAALRFARACGAHVALALSPQFTIDPRRPPFDRRWRREAQRIGYVEPPYSAPESAIVMFDPGHALDRAQAKLYLASPKALAVPIRFSGHPATGQLAESGMLQMLVRQVAAGAFDPEAFRRDAHAARRHSVQYHFVLAHRLQYRRPAAAVALLRHALATARQPHLLSLLGAILDREGAFDQAEGLHREALELAPDNADAIALQAWHFILRGRIREAREVIDDVIHQGGIHPSQLVHVVRAHLFADRLALGCYFPVLKRFARWRGAPMAPSREFWRRRIRHSR